MKNNGLILLFFLLVGNAAAQNEILSVDLPPELDRVLRDYENGWRGGDSEALAAIFTPDGYVMSSGRPAVHGRDAIIKRYAGAGGSLHLRAFAFETSGDTGFIIGGYTYDPDDYDSGKFILALRRDESGKWLISADIDNSNSR